MWVWRGGGGGVGIRDSDIIPEGRERDVTRLGGICARSDYGWKGIDQVHEDEPRDECKTNVCVWVVQGVVIFIVGIIVVVAVVTIGALVEGGDGVQCLDALGDDHDEGGADEDTHAEGGD